MSIAKDHPPRGHGHRASGPWRLPAPTRPPTTRPARGRGGVGWVVHALTAGPSCRPRCARSATLARASHVVGSGALGGSAAQRRAEITACCGIVPSRAPVPTPRARGPIVRDLCFPLRPIMYNLLNSPNPRNLCPLSSYLRFDQCTRGLWLPLTPFSARRATLDPAPARRWDLAACRRARRKLVARVWVAEDMLSCSVRLLARRDIITEFQERIHRHRHALHPTPFPAGERVSALPCQPPHPLSRHCPLARCDRPFAAASGCSSLSRAAPSRCSWSCWVVMEGDRTSQARLPFPKGEKEASARG